MARRGVTVNNAAAEVSHVQPNFDGQPSHARSSGGTGRGTAFADPNRVGLDRGNWRSKCAMSE
jgi:hypothetical protein